MSQQLRDYQRMNSMTSHYRENPVTDSDLIVIVLYSVDITGIIILMWKLMLLFIKTLF